MIKLKAIFIRFLSDLTIIDIEPIEYKICNFGRVPIEPVYSTVLKETIIHHTVEHIFVVFLKNYLCKAAGLVYIIISTRQFFIHK